ncbi:hypothetical protein BS50DRAFT_577000 [Corynespora cassiicola Philippines]|uniref:Uncharacterized protein n=1 Tax=Corynespora cassiicola Philippines TaxID=1448308 RepID=A0A2T2NCQ9_CORCC|nr:hypothetical protein BS50DRAFT_577000 [Corynespora cassiicola Philippines]
MSEESALVSLLGFLCVSGVYAVLGLKKKKKQKDEGGGDDGIKKVEECKEDEMLVRDKDGKVIRKAKLGPVQKDGKRYPIQKSGNSLFFLL